MERLEGRLGAREAAFAARERDLQRPMAAGFDRLVEETFAEIVD